ncbi:TetR family transcriptional regulator [Plastorhodobacter daqingensis]|uniref:TetR family transcriptional regulator n=1 Tax=Plastorhodobacter daqingensis TaxID=1387281 RepID=A0ABW2UND1_9RHOB
MTDTRHPPSLRDRRRRQTARDIQAAALRLVCAQGFDQVTTEAIAAEAGISPRTFFNYYPYKEAAIVGPPPALPAEAVARFLAAEGAVPTDLAALMRAHLLALEDARERFRILRSLARTQPKILALHQGSILALREGVERLVAQRLPDDPVLARYLAMLTLDAARIALDHWLEHDEPLAQVLDRVLSRLPDLGALLLQFSPSGSAHAPL